jgi:hypothetical protein
VPTSILNDTTTTLINNSQQPFSNYLVIVLTNNKDSIRRSGRLKLQPKHHLHRYSDAQETDRWTLFLRETENY